MPRSSKKPPFIDPHVLKKVFKGKTQRNVIIATRSRRTLIVPDFVGMTFNVYNGKSYIPVTIKEQMVGYKLGEFSPTRSFYGHGADKKVKKKR